MHPLSRCIIGGATTLLFGIAHASSVTYQSATSFGPDQPDAATYRSVVTQALAAPGSHSTTVALFDNLTSQGLFGGFNNNLAIHTVVDFAVGAAQAGNWSLRIGGDFGYGGAVFLDGVALGFRSTAMWWNFSWIDPTQSFQFSGVPMATGAHRLELFALEDCCDGGLKGQYSLDGVNFVTFGASDGLISPVVEPQTSALLLTGVAALAVLRRRRPKSGRRV